jgi:hypothetical protein
MIFRKKQNVLPVQRKSASFKAGFASVVVLSLLVVACGGSGTSSSLPSPVSNGSVSITATATTTAQSLTVGTAMASFSPLTPGGGATPYTYTYGGTIPAGLSLDARTGAVTGTPTATYPTANVVFSVQDAHGVVANTTSTVIFTVGAASPTINATATTTAQHLTASTAMTSFSPLTPSGGATPYTYYISSGALPAGLNLDAITGAVTGTPTTPSAAVVDVVFSVKDHNNVVASTTSSVSFTVGFAVSVPPSTGWTTVKMGGGGYIPGIIYHPTVANLRYARTDMDGVYRWDNGISKWTALTDAFAPEDSGNLGAESMAVDPTNANKVYMTTSMDVSWGNGRFYYSSDQGNTWNHKNLPFPIGSNNQGRAIGERLMVDPNFPSTMFYASRTAGLWKSIDSGSSWSQVTLPATHGNYVMTSGTPPNDITNSNGGSPVGVEFVVFDTTVPTSGFTPTGSPTLTIYIGVAPDYKGLAGLSSYLYKSIDGGTNWNAITIPGYVTSTLTSGIYIPHMARAADGMFYLPFTSSSGPGSGGPSVLYKFDGNSTWAQLRTNANAGMGGVAVSVIGTTTNIAVGMTSVWGAYNDLVIRSVDGGQTWNEIGWTGSHVATGTTGAASPSYWGWVDDLEIDPFNPDHVSYVVGGGVWSTLDAFSTLTPHWTFDVNGIEEMVNLGMTAPPPTASYALLSAHGDTGLYVNTSLTNAENDRSPNLGGGNGTGIDMAWNNPAFIAAVGTFGTTPTSGITTSLGVYSTDSGVNWTNFPTLPPVASTHWGDHSRVAVTADGSNVIWSIAGPTGGQIPYYTTDNGASWTATNLPAPMAAYNASYHIAADRKNPLKVYAYDHGGDFWNPPGSGKFYYSTDGGHTFTASAQTWDPYGFNNTDLAVNPFVEGDLWLADANNLWHSVDYGQTWKKLTGTLVGTGNTNLPGAIQHGAMKVALGVPAAGSSYSAAVYFVGRLLTGGVYVYGVYRSDDAGVSWTRIDDDNHRYGGVGGIVADTSVYGRVFLSGRGMDYNY